MPSAAPTPQEVVEAHRPLLRLVVEALRRGTVHAQEYADWQDEKIDRALAPALVRKGAKRYLIEKEQDVENEEDFDYEAEYLSNLGLMLRASGIQIRVLRSAPGHQMPVPGHSLARQQYYQQTLLDFDDPGVATAAPPVLVKLVLHWSTDSDYHLDRVYLGCPRTGGETRDSVSAYWDWPIWRRHDIAVDGQAQAEVTDLDIFLEEEATGTEG